MFIHFSNYYYYSYFGYKDGGGYDEEDSDD